MVQSCTVPCIAHTYDLYEQLESKLGLREKPERKANYDQTCANTRYGRRFLRKVYRSSVWALRINQYLVYFNL